MAGGSERTQFKKGNKQAKGGARAGAGRPPDVVKKAMKEMAEGRVAPSLAVIDGLLDPLSEAEPQVRLKAAELMLAYAWHKPTQPTQNTGDVTYIKQYDPQAPTESV